VTGQPPNVVDEQLRRDDLLAWQFAHYPEFHGSKANLALHVLTVPLFQAGSIFLVLGWLSVSWLPVVGLLMMALAVVAQGRGHALEHNPPVPFASRGEAVRRIVLEQWVNFPRYVVTGGFGRAWRAK